jgi:N-acetylglutamate synthase-like GNAT family acetyltransferase
LNEPGRFPAGILDQYRAILAENRGYFLVAEHNNRIIATGGITEHPMGPIILCYGLVHPDFHRQGIGTALLYARIALLNVKPLHPRILMLLCVETSVSFYEQLGFLKRATWKDHTGTAHPLATLVLTRSDVAKLRSLLKRTHIEYPLSDSAKISDLLTELPQRTVLEPTS